MGKVFLLLSITLATFCSAKAVYGAAICPSVKQFGSSFVPACDGDDLRVKWPSYENASAYYVCFGLNSPVMMSCPPDQYFIFVLQGCGSCRDYIQPVECSKLPTEKPPNCTDIGGQTTPQPEPKPTSQPQPTLPTPRYPSSSPSPTAKPTKTTSIPVTKPTVKPTDKPTAKPTVKPSSPKPTPPTPSSPSTPSLPAIKPPPSPSTQNPNVPQPPTPLPTPPNVPVAPPQVTPKPPT